MDSILPDNDALLQLAVLSSGKSVEELHSMSSQNRRDELRVAVGNAIKWHVASRLCDLTSSLPDGVTDTEIRSRLEAVLSEIAEEMDRQLTEESTDG
jgi:hypothetical protein